MGSKAAPQYGNPGFSNSAFMGGGNTPLARQLRGLHQVQPLPPIAQAIQPIRARPRGRTFTRGNRRTTTLVPGAPLLPDNPYADAAWRRAVYGPK